jgi:hypothetical protein
VGLWHFLARAAVSSWKHGFDRDAALLFAVEVARGESGEERQYLEAVAQGATEIGWRHAGVRPIAPADVTGTILNVQSQFTALGVFGSRSLYPPRWTPTVEGMVFARSVLAPKPAGPGAG